jgi:hypothetical protein
MDKKTKEARIAALRRGERVVTIEDGKTIVERRGRPRIVFDPSVRRPPKLIADKNRAPRAEPERSAKA